MSLYIIVYEFSIAIKYLERLLFGPETIASVCVCPVNWETYLQNHYSSRLQIIRETESVTARQHEIWTLENLSLQPLESRIKIVTNIVKTLLGMWSGVDEADYDMNISLHKYGIDSMAATNMKIRIQNHIGAIFEVGHFYLNCNIC